jgi:GNAT superfamily N-acetyltransferase
MVYMSSNLAAIAWRWVWLFLVHKRRQESLLKRHIRHLMFDNSRYDRERAEHVSLVSRIELLDLVQTNSDLSAFPDVIKGEVLIDYRSHRVPAPRKIFCLKRDWNELCGVIVYSYPASTSFGRRLVMPKMNMKELNQKLSSISRVVVHPKYRTAGLGSKLIRDTLPLAGTEFVEMSAVMAKYNPFAEKAGMTKVALQDPPKEALKVLDVLKKLGFNEEMLGSARHVNEKLEAFAPEQIAELRETFSRNRHMRFSKSFSYHMPYGTVSVYRREIKNASLEKLGVLIRICGFLLQSKVYLYWKKG